MRIRLQNSFLTMGSEVYLMKLASTSYMMNVVKIEARGKQNMHQHKKPKHLEIYCPGNSKNGIEFS